mmetsp:Transcript_72528/g.201127  ORF Transcript_72528/g.201127 Transcript_72528/m.201127 type:complete len:227 (-) Transcript_72528:1058-1738(-)
MHAPPTPPPASAPSAMAPSSGRAVLHLRQFEFRLNCTSPQPGQTQSPGSAKNGVPFWPTTPASAGRAVAQRRQRTFRENCKSPQPGHIQSPGFGWRLDSTRLPLSLSLAMPMGPPFPASAFEGLGVPHLLQLSFLLNCKSPQLGQVQSPGSASIGLPSGFELPTRPASSGFMVPQRRQDGLLTKTWSPQFGQIQSPGLPSGGGGACTVATPSCFTVPQRRQDGLLA